MVSQMFARFTYSLIFTAMQRDLGLSYTLVGSIGSANLAAYLLAVVGVTWLATRWPADRMVRTGLIVATVGIGGIAFAPSTGWLVVAFVVAGASGALVWVPIPAVATALLPLGRKGLGYGVVGSGIGTGMILASLVVSTQRFRIGDAAWRLTYQVQFVIAIVVTIAAWRVFKGLTAIGNRGSVRVTAIQDVPRWPSLLVAYGAYALCYSLFLNFLVALLEVDRGMSVGLSSSMFLILGAAIIPGGIMGGWASDRWGRRRSLIVMYALLGLPSMVALFAGPGWIIPAVFAFGLVFVGIPAVISAHIGDRLDPTAFAAAWGVATLAFGFGQMLAPQLGGLIGDATGSFVPVFHIAFWVALLGGAAAFRATAEPGGSAAG
jgi:MFS family permease